MNEVNTLQNPWIAGTSLSPCHLTNVTYTNRSSAEQIQRIVLNGDLGLHMMILEGYDLNSLFTMLKMRLPLKMTRGMVTGDVTKVNDSIWVCLASMQQSSPAIVPETVAILFNAICLNTPSFPKVAPQLIEVLGKWDPRYCHDLSVQTNNMPRQNTALVAKNMLEQFTELTTAEFAAWTSEAQDIKKKCLSTPSFSNVSQLRQPLLPWNLAVGFREFVMLEEEFTALITKEFAAWASEAQNIKKFSEWAHKKLAVAVGLKKYHLPVSINTQTVNHLAHQMRRENLRARTTLGLDEQATDEMIRKRYRELALQFHPDKHAGYEQNFREIQTAYQKLTASEKEKCHLRDYTNFDELLIAADTAMNELSRAKSLSHAEQIAKWEELHKEMSSVTLTSQDEHLQERLKELIQQCWGHISLLQITTHILEQNQTFDGLCETGSLDALIAGLPLLIDQLEELYESRDMRDTRRTWDLTHFAFKTASLLLIDQMIGYRRSLVEALLLKGQLFEARQQRDAVENDFRKISTMSRCITGEKLKRIFKNRTAPPFLKDPDASKQGLPSKTGMVRKSSLEENIEQNMKFFNLLQGDSK